MRIIIIGVGPIGGIIGGRLAREGRDTTFVDVDREHVTAIRTQGLHVHVPDGPFTVAIPVFFPGEVEGRFDLGCIAVRSQYTMDALKTAMDHLTPGGLLVSLQNGMNPPLLEEQVGPDRTIGAVVRMGSRRTAPGQVATATRGHLYLGHLHGGVTPQLATVADLFNSVIPSEISPDIFGMLWSKLTFTCLGYFGSLADDSLLTICASEANRDRAIALLAEVIAVGTARGVRFQPLKEYNPPDLSSDKPLDARRAVLRNLARSWKPDDRTGQLAAIQKGVKTEVDFTLGHVIREGERFGIATPLCRHLLTMIHELETGKRDLALRNYAELAAS